MSYDSAEHFRCDRLNCTLTRQLCADNYRQSNSGSAAVPKAGLDRAIAYDRRKPSCIECVTGNEHKHGWAVEPAVQLVRVVSKPRLRHEAEPGNAFIEAPRVRRHGQ